MDTEDQTMGMLAPSMMCAQIDKLDETLRAFEKAGFVILQQQSAYDGRPRCYLRKGLV